MISGLIIALGAVALTFAVVKNWKSILQWFKDFVTALISLFSTVIKGVAHAAAAFIEVAIQGFADLKHKLYYEEDDHYVEEIRVRQLSEDQLPAWAKKKLNRRSETDVTNEIESEIQMTL